MHEEVVLDDSQPDRTVRIGAIANEELSSSLKNLLREYKDIFAFTVEEMPGIDPSLAVHRLTVYPDAKPVRQKKRNHGEERNQSAAAEVKKPLEAKFVHLEKLFP